MEIKVRLFATLRENRGKELMIKIANGDTVNQIIAELNIEKEEVAILLINGRDGLLDTPLKEGDVVSIFPPVGGG